MKTPQPEEQDDFAKIRDRWEKCLADGTFDEWFDRAKPKPPWHWKWVFIFLCTICLFPVSIIILLGRINRLLNRKSFKRIYYFDPKSARFLIAYGYGYLPKFSLGIFEDTLGSKRMLIPAERRVGKFGWDSEMIDLIDRMKYNRSTRQRHAEVLKMLDSELPLKVPFVLPKELTNGREVWVVDTPNLAVQSLLRDPSPKPVIVPCAIPRGCLSWAVTLPQFLIEDFLDIKQEFRKTYSKEKPVFQQIIDSEEPMEVVRVFNEYLMYENGKTWSREEELIYDVYSIEPFVRERGLADMIAAFRQKRVLNWIDGLKVLNLPYHHREASKLIPFLRELTEKFGDYSPMEYDDIVFEISELIPSSFKYLDTQPFDVPHILLEYAVKNQQHLR